MRYETYLKVLTLLLIAAVPAFGVKAASTKLPVRAVVNIEVMNTEEVNGIILGGAAGTTWLSPSATASRLRGGERYWFYSMKGIVGEAVGGKATKEDYLVQFSQVKSSIPASAITQLSDMSEIAIASPKAIPRQAKTVRPSNTDLAAVDNALRRKGLRRGAKDRISVYAVDLEGDGSVERIVNATSGWYDPWTWSKGQYSLAMLRIARGKMNRSIMLNSQFHQTTKQNAYAEEYSIAGFWDVDGDGRMEIGVRVFCAKADVAIIDIYRVRNGSARRIASGGLGN